MRVDLRRTNEELEQFAYVASHDLKAPLRGIENLVGWIEEDLEGSLTGDVQTNMDLLKSRVQRLESLLDDLLAYSRAGRADVAFAQVDTKALVEELAQLVSPPEGFEIVAADDLPTVKAAKAPLTQAFQNLIGNAIKHHDRPGEGHVRVDAQPSADMVEFVVTDDGAGIPEQFRERVFGMFQTLRPRDEVEGSGMGLAIVRKLVERQGGKVWLTEDERVAASRCTSRGRRTTRRGIRMGSTVNLLLVDDDEVDVQGLKRAFKKSKIGNPITVARDGIEALEFLRGQNGKEKLPKPHLILLDLNMPRMNGIEFLEEIRADEDLRTAVVFMITTSKADEDRMRAYGHNVAGYIVKRDPANTFMEAVSMLEHFWKVVEFPQ